MKLGHACKQEKIRAGRIISPSHSDYYVRGCRLRAGSFIHYHLVTEFPSANP